MVEDLSGDLVVEENGYGGAAKSGGEMEAEREVR